MRLSRDKVIHLSHLLVQALDDEDLVTWLTDQNTLRTEIVNFIIEDLKTEEDADKEVRRILRSYKRKIVEGSREWDVMYQKTFEEYMKKRGRLM
ncbi:DUF507 family protein [candidate division KSB3 bacterium]|jgi:hypothetical protein|uniref:DUF507 family protein n=1 Tax=candidate division KSB3 bacterium TaxID=2044937 RepID=A0A9D5JVP6_9BACT|nr:DUF507 family protein [candidate division KSB3 bacterium]MBD3325134.1 DUF507 family protein [candidate division KSB3 bacterium]